ncbi:MAG: protease family protein [Acidobacteriota bacterium]|nr:protease family protein [Acidobacteriota bacterium]
MINSPGRVRYLIDIIVIVVAYFGFDAFADALPLPENFRIVIVVSTLVKCLYLLLVWFSLRWRGDRLATIGLQKPRNWFLAIAGGVLYAAVLFAGVYLLERAGFRRDMSAYVRFKGDLEFTLYQLGGITIGAGFGEEFVFRGFLFHRVAVLFGGNKAAWAVACVIQAALFGAIHAYQNPMGMLLTGTIALISGIVFLAIGRNLWLLIIAHTLYDTARVIAFYLHGPPPW